MLLGVDPVGEFPNRSFEIAGQLIDHRVMLGPRVLTLRFCHRLAELAVLRRQGRELGTRLLLAVRSGFDTLVQGIDAGAEIVDTPLHGAQIDFDIGHFRFSNHSGPP